MLYCLFGLIGKEKFGEEKGREERHGQEAVQASTSLLGRL